MTKRAVLAVAWLILLVSPATAFQSVAFSPRSNAPRAISAEVVASGLKYPVGFTFSPDGRIVYGERFTGEIHIYDPATGNDTLFAKVPHVNSDGLRGLIGIALHPDYPAKPYVYAYASRNVMGRGPQPDRPIPR
jgi:glucose/arabinose dehydrogenase